MALTNAEKCEQYIQDVLSGKEPACRWVRLAVERHVRDLERSEKGLFRYVFEPGLGERPCKVIELLPHTKGKWAAKGENLVLEPWQAFIFCSVFGWVDRRTRKRRFREAVIIVPRKNGKSAMSAGAGLYMLAYDNEHGAEVYCIATTENQAWEVFKPAKIMAATPKLKQAKGIDVNAKAIVIQADASVFRPLIGDPPDGSSPSFAIIDEYHEHDTSDALDTMVTGMGAREQPLLWVITTAGDNIAGPCYAKQLALQDILSGSVTDETVFGIVYTIDAEDDWTDPAVLRKANPNMGVSVSEEFLLNMQQQAIRTPREQGRFKTKHLNMWVNSRAAYFNMESWLRCPAAPPIEELRGRNCRIGLDLASTRDIAALEMLFDVSHLYGDGHYARYGKSYLPEAVVEDPANAHYQQWRDQGHVELTGGNITDYAKIEQDIIDFCSMFNVIDVAVDPFQANYLITRLREKRVPALEYRQTVETMSTPMKTFDAWIVGGLLHHNCGPDHPMTWQMSNVTGKEDAKDNVYPRKERAEKKIDNPVAQIMCIGRVLADNENRTSIYEDRGLLVF
jgi:phage terminase large subunit-like protein